MPQQFQYYSYKHWTVLGRNRFKVPFRFSDALINEARIVHILAGRSRMYSANQFIELSAGDTVIMKADNFVNDWTPLNDTGSECGLIAFQLNSELLHELYTQQTPSWMQNNPSGPRDPVLQVQPTPVLQGFFNQLQLMMDDDAGLSEELVKLKTLELISLLIQQDTTDQTNTLFSQLFTATEYQFQEVINSNLYKDLKLDELAFLTNMSLSSFKRKFTQVYGSSPTKYFISKRLEKAQELLMQSNLRVSDIAYECGFSDVAYFSKTFKQYYNCAPSELRKPD